MVNASEGVMRRRQGDPAYAGYLSTRQEAGPKGNGSRPGLPLESQAALDTELGVKHRPIYTTYLHYKTTTVTKRAPIQSRDCGVGFMRLLASNQSN